MPCAGRAGLLALGFAFSVPLSAQPLPPSPILPNLGTGPTFLSGRAGGAFASPVTPGFDGLGYPFGPNPVQPAGPARAWTIAPSLGLSLIGTDNATGSSTNKQGDFITRIFPGIAANADLNRLSGQLFFSPVATFSANNTISNSVNYLFNGQGLATLVENALFLDLRGFGGIQTIGGGFAPGAGAFGTSLSGTPIVNSANQVQTVSLSASPYTILRFAGSATAQIGYTYGYTSTAGQTTFLPGSTQPFFRNSETSSNIGYAVIRSGEELGRMTLESRTTAAFFNSNGVLAGAQRIISSVQALYAVTREVGVLVEGGYENLDYGGTNPLRFSGPVWSVGVRLQPNQDSVIIARYGKRDGFNSAFLNANVFVGGRTRLFATYSETLGTAGLQAQDLLTTATVDPLGNLVSATTGAPVGTPFGGSLLSTQNTLSRTKLATAGASQAWLRDSVTLNFTYNENIPVTSQIGTTGFQQQGYFVGLNWSRSLTPVLTGSVGAQVGQTQSQVAGKSNFYGGNLGLARELAPGLSGDLRYFYTHRDGLTVLRGGSVVQGSGPVAINTLLLSLRQTF